MEICATQPRSRFACGNGCADARSAANVLTAIMLFAGNPAEVSTRRLVATMTALWLCGVAMRMTILAMPPVIPLVHAPDDPGPDLNIDADPVPEPTTPPPRASWQRFMQLFR